MVQSSKNYERPKTNWCQKFANALRGLAVGMRGQNSYPVHLAVAAAVVVAAIFLRLSMWQWCLLILCIALVLAAELFNTALERLARVVTQEENPLVRDALDISAAAVLTTSLGALIVGCVVFLQRLLGS